MRFRGVCPPSGDRGRVSLLLAAVVPLGVRVDIMPPRVQPKFYQLTIKTHKLSIFLPKVPQTQTINELKSEYLSAIASHAYSYVPPLEDGSDVPQLSSPDDFELCRSVRDQDAYRRGVLIVEYKVLDGKASVKGSLNNWESLFVQFKDRRTGELLPIQVTIPSLQDDEDEPPAPSRGRPEPSPGKGKRRASSTD
ncbi:hypothetical protein PUNSTDRAFT_142493 [Punctularia strigosozonata HHB-11173 SS5]|uniref:uncharacterized protein n=1 Tax=Punctularia strigosozonata (strain HHB-11173) TaxID=741275 RepID=UPI00044180DB|nr:uncharacterized protein PUNSTDRAFT_142493 [Punctularia strigosozonata HHB-11173 SS5]EIN10486.1 hypothetical protein PUNSTDRAFT_142493 [Punctularia strigosozonata HHB-11173 SS5]